MNVADAPTDQAMTLVRLDNTLSSSVASRLRLRELGLRPGSRLSVKHVTPFGGRIIQIDNRRIALDAATARAVQVVPLASSPHLSSVAAS